MRFGLILFTLLFGFLGNINTSFAQTEDVAISARKKDKISRTNSKNSEEVKKAKSSKSQKGPSIKISKPFYPAPTNLTRNAEQNMHTSMVNMGQIIEMDVVSTTRITQQILPMRADTQQLIVKPKSIVGYMNTNGNKQDISQEDSITELLYTIDKNGVLIHLTGSEDYIKAMKMSGINNAQTGLNIMVYFKHDKELFLNDSFTISHDGNPYTFQKTLILTSLNAEEAIFSTRSRIVLDQNYDMNEYDIHQRVEGTSTGVMKVQLSDYLVTYNEENLELSGNMEMVTVNIPITIKGTMKEFVTKNN
jgi:hypothetical protein